MKQCSETVLGLLQQTTGIKPLPDFATAKAVAPAHVELADHPALNALEDDGVTDWSDEVQQLTTDYHAYMRLLRGDVYEEMLAGGADGEPAEAASTGKPPWTAASGGGPSFAPRIKTRRTSHPAAAVRYSPPRKQDLQFTKPQVFAYFRNLRLVDRKIDELDAKIAAFRNLKQLSLTGNSVRDVQNLPPGLEILQLNANGLDQFPDFRNLRALQHLGLSHNRLRDLGRPAGAESARGGADARQAAAGTGQRSRCASASSGGRALSARSRGRSGSSCGSRRTLSRPPGGQRRPPAVVGGDYCLLPPNLVSLDVSFNEMEDLDAAAATLAQTPSLKIVAFMGNPMALRPRYKSRITSAVSRLICLDDQPADRRDGSGAVESQHPEGLEDDEALIEVCFERIENMLIRPSSADDGKKPPDEFTCTITAAFGAPAAEAAMHQIASQEKPLDPTIEFDYRQRLKIRCDAQTRDAIAGSLHVSLVGKRYTYSQPKPADAAAGPATGAGAGVAGGAADSEKGNQASPLSRSARASQSKLERSGSVLSKSEREKGSSNKLSGSTGSKDKGSTNKLNVSTGRDKGSTNKLNVKGSTRDLYKGGGGGAKGSAANKRKGKSGFEGTNFSKSVSEEFLLATATLPTDALLMAVKTVQGEFPILPAKNPSANVWWASPDLTAPLPDLAEKEDAEDDAVGPDTSSSSVFAPKLVARITLNPD